MTRQHMRLLTAGAAVAVVCALVPGSARGAALPSDFEPTWVSAVSSSTWWLLGQSASCITFSCRITLLETTDGGRSFTTPGPLPDLGPTGMLAANRHSLFVTDSKGHVWLSPDGGTSWRDVVPTGAGGKPLFEGMPTVGGGYAYAVEWPPQGPDVLVRASLSALASGADPNRAWKRLPSPLGTLAGLEVHGSELLLLAQPLRSPAFPRLYASTDAGRTFRPTGAKLPVIGCSFDPTGTALWADCSTGMLFGIWRSTDGGRTFAAAGSDAYRTPPERDHLVFAGTSGAAFAALSPSTALLGLSPLYRTTDGGGSYRRLIGTPTGIDRWLQFDVLGPDDVLAIGNDRVGGSGAHPRFINRLYVVSAGGTRYRRVRVG